MKITNMLKQRVLCLLLGLAFWFASEATAGIYTDGFEGTSITSFWTWTGPGTATLTNLVANSGSHSVQLATSSSYPWSVSLGHDLRSEESGSVSIYVHSQLCCGSSAGLQIIRTNGDWANIQQLDNGGFQTRVSIGGIQSGHFFTGSNLNWHLFQIAADSNGVTVKLDGSTVLTDSSITTFRFVSLDVWGGPGGSAYFDDFTANIVSSCAVPSAEITTPVQHVNSLGQITGCWNPDFPYACDFLQTLQGGTFLGRSIKEVNAAPAVDTCWFSDSQLPPARGINPDFPGWSVNDQNEWGYDTVGWKRAAVNLPDPVTYYRSSGRAPCHFLVWQQMQIQCTDGTWQNYGPINPLVGTIGPNSISSCRAGVCQSKRY